MEIAVVLLPAAVHAAEDRGVHQALVEEVIMHVGRHDERAVRQSVLGAQVGERVPRRNAWNVEEG